MPLIKMAAFDVSNTIMTSLAANSITAVIGNWVRSRGKGVIDGFDYGTAGEIDKLEVEAIKTVLNHGFIPIFPCIGWNSIGHPYNISSMLLAQQVAVNLKADKLFYVTQGGGLYNADSNVPAMTLEEVDDFINQNTVNDETKAVLQTAKDACQNGVARVHLVDGAQDGVILTEIFSDLGSGTMIYTSNYGKIRPMEQTDIPSVLGIIGPFVKSGKLLPRTQQQLENTFGDYVVYSVDGGVHACAALHLYEDGQAEIAAVAVDEHFEHMGIGPKLIESLIAKAKSKNVKSVFIMTTQAADWFEKLGFEEDKIESLPEKRREIWTAQRNSKVFRLKK